jgi:hypothetical protein
MNNQSLILLGLGLFVGIFVSVVAIDHYLLTEHGPLDPEGLILRAETAFSRIEDLEAVLEVAGEDDGEAPVRVLVRYKAGVDAALSVRYSPDDPQGEMFTVSRDLLSHYLPDQDMIVIKRWFGVPLAALGLASFDLAQLEKDRQASRVKLRVLGEEFGFDETVFRSSLVVAESFAAQNRPEPYSIGLGMAAQTPHAGIAAVMTGPEEGSIQGGLILEVTDLRTGEVTRRIWVDRKTYLVTKTASYSGGKMVASVRVERITLNQGLTAEEILALPKAAETIRG